MTIRNWPVRPRLGRSFYKAHGLGNDYLVFEEGDDWDADEAGVVRVCDRTRGIGADGIVALLAEPGGPLFRARMFNPDGSEFERSGNGLRILASYLARKGSVDADPFRVEVAGAEVEMTVHGSVDGRYDVSVSMGVASVGPDAVAMRASAFPSPGALPGPDGADVSVTPVWVGNPHLVVFDHPLDDDSYHALGPFLAEHPALAHGSNVQVARVVGPGHLFARIWERGVGPTSASGTSACAVAVASVVGGLQPPGAIRVESEGGTLTVRVTSELEVTLRGPVEAVCTGLFEALGAGGV